MHNGLWTKRHAKSRMPFCPNKFGSKRLIGFRSSVNVFSCFIVCCFVLSGCAVGPRYVPPVANIPLTWITEKHPRDTKKITYTHWWRHFHDPVLNELIEHQVVFNLNVKIAEEQINAAQAGYSIAYAKLFPEMSVNALPPNATGFDLAQVFALTTAIEPDFFGKQRENIKRAKANLEVEQAEKDATLLKLQAEIAISYMELREIQTKKRTLQHSYTSNKDILNMLQSHYTKGTINYISLAQQKALMETELAKIEQDSALEIAIIHKLEVLTGKNHGGLTHQLHPYRPVPPMTRTINLAVPSELLRRRPDIIAAEKRVEAAHANIRVATAELFPKITMGWLLAWQTQSLSSNLFALNGPQSLFFGLLDAPLLSLRLARMVDLRKREKAVTVLVYEMTVLNALHEVETQYNYCVHSKASATHFKRALTQKKLVLFLASDSYKKGASDFNTVLRAEEDVSLLDISYLHQVVAFNVAQIRLYQALGGDIRTSTAVATKVTSCSNC